MDRRPTLTGALVILTVLTGTNAAFALGILVFDVTPAPAEFVAESPELGTAFLRITHDADAMWNAGGDAGKAMIPVITNEAGMDKTATAGTMATFVFPDIDALLSGTWLGGGVQSYMQGVAGVFKDAGAIPASLDSYDATIDTAPLTAALAK